MTARRLIAAVATLLLAAAAVVAGAGPASAHAVLVGSDPSDGATLAAPPRQLHLRLSEAVMPNTTKIKMTDGSGRTLDLGAVRVGPTAQSGTGLIYKAGDPGAPTTITVDLPSLAPDVYRIAWQTLSAADLHVTSGVVVFGVQRGVTAAAAGADDPLPPLVEVALRWLALLGAAVAGGALVVTRLSRGLLPSRSSTRLLRVGAGAGAVAVLAGAGLVLAQAWLDGVSPGQVLGSGYGLRWALREAAGIALAVLCARPLARRSPEPSSRSAYVAAGALLAFTVTTVTLGHAGAGGLTQPVRFLADAVHVGAALLWVGLVAAVALVGADRRSRPHWRPVARRIGVLAAGSVALLSVTGLLLAAAQVASLDALLVSTYGRLLLVKLGVAAAGGVAGLLVATTVRPQLPALLPAGLGRRAARAAATASHGRRLAALVAVEAVALIGVVFLAAGVASARPASGPEWVPASSAVPLQSADVRDLVETVAVSPNRPGRNFVTVDVFQTRRPEPGPIRAVSAVLRRPGAAPVTVPLHAERTGRWVAATDAFEAPGTWQVDVIVERAGVGTDSQGYPWLVADPAARLAAPVVSSAPLDRLLQAAAGVLAALLAFGAVTLWRASSSRGRTRPGRFLPPAQGAPGYVPEAAGPGDRRAPRDEGMVADRTLDEVPAP